MTTTTQYPAWQAKIREAQVESERQIAQQRDEEDARQREQLQKDADWLVEVLAKAGIEAPANLKQPEFTIDGYTFAVARRDYNKIIRISCAVPDHETYTDDPESDIYYYHVASEEVYSKHPKGADIAYTIDRLDLNARDLANRNANMLERLSHEVAPKSQRNDIVRLISFDARVSHETRSAEDRIAELVTAGWTVVAMTGSSSDDLEGSFVTVLLTNIR